MTTLPHARTTALLVAAWFPFLVFAEFGLLGLVRERVPAGPLQPAVLALLVVPGVVAALRSTREAEAVRRGLSAAALGGLAAALPGWVAPLVAAPLTGWGLGLATAGLAGELGARCGTEARAVRTAALGTALGYLGANLPGVFDASPAAQGVLGGLSALAGAALAGRPPPLPDPAPPPSARRDPLRPLVLLLGGLVAIDSLLFAAVQAEEAARLASWGTPTGALLLGVAHAVAAVAAGAGLDRRRLAWQAAASGPILAVAGLGLLVAPGWWAACAYAAAVSNYSVALVAAPLLACQSPAATRRIAGPTYALGGWVASAAGLALAGPTGTPGTWPLVAGVAVAVPLAWSGAARLARILRREAT